MDSSPAPTPAPISKGVLRTSYIMTALPVLMFGFSAVMKLAHPPGLDKGFEHLGWPVRLATPLGILELACVIVYLVPRTTVLGAILVTAYLGGATATHVRVGDPFVMQPLLGVLVWGGLFLRDPRLRALLLPTRPT